MMRYRSFLILGLSIGLLVNPDATVAQTPLELTVMSFNVWGGGANEGKSTDETVAVIRAADADIIGIQETRLEGDICEADYCPPSGESVAAAIAASLGYYHHDQAAENPALWANAIISRYPIVEATPNDLGVAIDVGGRTVYAYNIHLDDSPYQPYQLAGIEYGYAPFLETAEDAIAFAEWTRGPAVFLLREDLQAASEADATFVLGDFNEPSHRDWTDATVEAGLHPLPVAWPTTRVIEAEGFVDAYRVIHGDAVAKPGFTWTPTSDAADPSDHHDRIDFVFARAAGLTVLDAAIVGEASEVAELVVTPWPSDHRAVVATVAVP